MQERRYAKLSSKTLWQICRGFIIVKYFQIFTSCKTNNSDINVQLFIKYNYVFIQKRVINRILNIKRIHAER